MDLERVCSIKGRLIFGEREERARDLMADDFTVSGSGRIVRERDVLEVVWRLNAFIMNMEDWRPHEHWE